MITNQAACGLMNSMFTEEEAQNSDSICSPVVEEQSEVSSSKGPGQGKNKPKIPRIPKIFKKKIAKNNPKADLPDTPGITTFCSTYDIRFHNQ